MSCHVNVVTIQNAHCGNILATFYLNEKNPGCCCFSPDGKIIAFGIGNMIHLWDITGSYPHFVKTLIEHQRYITSLAFSSPHILISASLDGTIKFLHMSPPLTDPVTDDTNSISTISAPIKAVSLQTKDDLAFSIDSSGIVMTWDTSTGHFKQSSRTPAKDIGHGDMQLIRGRLIVVWCNEPGQPTCQLCAWGVKGDQLQKMYIPPCLTKGIRISGDGSMAFHIYGVKEEHYIQVWSLQTGELTNNVKLGHTYTYFLDPLRMDDSKILIQNFGLTARCWDFGTLGSTPTCLSKASVAKYRVNFVSIPQGLQATPIVRIEDSVTGKQVFLLPGRYAHPFATQWDGQHLIMGYGSGEVLILNLSHIHL